MCDFLVIFGMHGTCMCVFGSLVIIGMGFSMCDNVLQTCLAISGEPWCDGFYGIWLSWISGWF